MKKKTVAILLAGILVALMMSGCGGGGTTEPTPETELSAEPKGTIILSTTTSTQDSGLLEYLLPIFTEETGWEVDVIAVGTGAALQMGRDGEADALLVHSTPDEIIYVEEGYGIERFDVMYNDYVVVGPQDGIGHNGDIEGTFKTIADESLPFISRGDDSGTHKKELSIWKALDIDIETIAEYVSAGQGMGATLQMADEMQAYTLADRATWLSQKSTSLVIVCEGSEQLRNQYGVIAVNPSLNDKINAEGGQAFVDWMISARGQQLISEFGVEEYGEALFTPNAK